jgi:DinB superfamily
MSRMQPLLDAYLDGPDELTQAVAGMTRDQLTARPIAGKWSTLEVVCHLADFDTILADRMKQIIALDQPALKGVDENRFASALSYQDRDIEEELAVIAASRMQMARILRKQSDATLDRLGIHSERGPLTLEKILTSSGRHIPHHCAFILEKKKALGIG